MITIDFDKLPIDQADDTCRILDLGCGDGRHVCESLRFPNAFVIGTDIRIEDLEKTKERIRFHKDMGLCRGIPGIVGGNARELPFQNEFFDVVICSEVLEHITDLPAALDEIKRVLKNTACLAVSVPRYYPEKICWALSREYRSTPGGHVRIFRKKQIIRLFENDGFNLLGYHYAHAIHSPYWWLKCLFGPDKDSIPVNLYHRFLVWDMLKKPGFIRSLDRFLNPILGKSLVLYFRKG